MQFLKASFESFCETAFRFVVTAVSTA